MDRLLNHSNLQNFLLIKPKSSSEKPFIITSAHSGIKRTNYIEEKTQLDKENYLSMEDSFINDISSSLSGSGCTILQSNISRIVIDLNRDETELCPHKISNIPKNTKINFTDKVQSGIGLIPTKNGSGENIYENKISWEEVKYRINNYYYPWHSILKEEKDRILNKFGEVFIIDLHSMPSIYGNNKDIADFVIGNNYDNSSKKSSRIILSEIISSYGYKSSFNYPYSGGYITQKNGSLDHNTQCIQIEINKHLYMDEKKIIKKNNFEDFCSDLKSILEEFFIEIEISNKELFAAE